MKILSTDSIPSGETEKLWVYNALDCMVTLEVFNVTSEQLDNTTRNTYEFRKSLQAPVLEMGMRGIRVDNSRRLEVIEDYRKDLSRLTANLERLFVEGVGVKVSWSSPAQLKHFFYTVLGLPPIRKRNSKGEYTPTVDRNALEKLQAYFIARPFITHILAGRDLAKKISVLETEIEADGRMRTSYNIAGTNTGRFSSSLSEFGFGTNLQNIEKKLRSVFVADPGFKLCEIDLEQAESRAVGAIEWNLFKDPTYLDACESGDLHTSVARLAWPQLPWTGDLRRDKVIAEQPFYRQHSYRHMAKVLGHGTNYDGKPPTMSVHTKLEIPLIKEFQARYFTAFPAHRRWHAWVAGQLLSEGQLTTLLGMRRSFFGRRDDPSTIRQAIAYEPQSVVGQLLNQGLLALWRAKICQLLLQVHDAVVFQYPESEESWVVPAAQAALRIPIELRHGRTLIIPSEAKVGWNWGPWSPENPDGLKAFGSPDLRRRTRP